MDSEFKNSTDHKDKGTFPVPGENGEVYLPFFDFVFIYPMGPCSFDMAFKAGGVLGISFDVNVQAIDSLLTTKIEPYVAGKFNASLSLSIVVASAGIDLKGYVLKSGFPLSLETNYNKQPVVTTKKLEAEIIPIELSLFAWLKILFVINIKKQIWHWKAPPWSGVIWEKVYRKDDTGPPRFLYCDKWRKKTKTDRIRKSNVFCQANFTAEDDDSDLKLSYAIGDYPGGTNIVGWTEMRGASLLQPAVLPCGIPIYFLVKARNSQGLETTAHCSLDNYDCTFPDGRVDADYRCSSHPSMLSVRVIMYEDSPLKTDGLFHGVGYSPSSFGHEVVDWLPLTVSNSEPQPGVSGDLRNFNPPRPGRLTSTPKQSLKTANAESCASKCLRLRTCVSFTYNQLIETCELQEVTEGPNAERKLEDNYETYERLGTSFTAVLHYTDMSLRHGTMYFVNADVENVLGYHSTLTSQGTMVDFTPPEPGPVGATTMDSLASDGCDVSILQRCVDYVPSSRNHRKIVDGQGASTVFNGNKKGQELKYTFENNHASANWDGFKDEECGIHGYTFSVGSTVCGTDIADFTDPHASIRNPDDWTNTGVAKHVFLDDGQYYVTVQAVSDIIHGGDLVTTVCHSTPFVVDTSPPVLNNVNDVLFDETFRFLVVYYDATDDVSGVARMEFGLGKTKYDVAIRPYIPFEIRGKENTYLVNEEFEITDGVAAWIRLKVVNNVELSVTGSSDAPILVDSSAPIVGHVMDGAELGRDICCQNNANEICAHWTGFDDPESSIGSYFWGVGLAPGQDDVVPFVSLSNFDKQSCKQVQLEHNVTYFSTVIANNRALNQKSSNSSSDGVLIDITPPVPGNVSDGENAEKDEDFTSEAATMSASWAGFYDPESGLQPYTLTVLVNDDIQTVIAGLQGEHYIDHTFSFTHGDRVQTKLQATNRAGGAVSEVSDGLLVDRTPPELLLLSTANQAQYQQQDDVLNFTWHFKDPESGIAEYRCVVFENYQGTRSKVWPEQTDFHVIQVDETLPQAHELPLTGMHLYNGGSYSLKVTAVNRAKISTSGETDEVTIDTTPPLVLQITLARPGEVEELNDKNEVELVDKEPIWVTWKPRDVQSGIKETRLCIGLAASANCITSDTDVRKIGGSLPFTTSFHDMNLTVTTDEDQKVLYQVYIVVINGAGASSTVAASKPFYVLKANVPGVVLDGREATDVDFSNDKASIAITFSGFSSAACGITGYEWGVGTQPFITDVMPYTHFGLVVDEQGRGFAQAHIKQFEGQTYYSTVRARTGHNCHEEYIVSSSNGFALDTQAPVVKFTFDKYLVTSNQAVYQTTGSDLAVEWDAEDSSGVNRTQLVLNVFDTSERQSFPVASISADPFRFAVRHSSGDSVYSALLATDKAGNEFTSLLPVVTYDFFPPTFLELDCTRIVSVISSLISCSWVSVKEAESGVSSIELGLGRGRSDANLLNFSFVPVDRREWTFDVKDLIRVSNISELYVLARASNGAGLNNDVLSTAFRVFIDATPPSLTSVSIVTSPAQGFHETEQRCQTSQDYIEIVLEGESDTESKIKGIEIALGSNRGRTDVRSFRQYSKVNGMYVLGHLGLSKGSTVYATVRVTNTVGLYTIGTSNAVVISPEPRLEVWDGPGDSDTDGQSELGVMQGSWSYSEPCPILSADWSVRGLKGDVIANYSSIPGLGHKFYNDAVKLENLKTYVNVVRIKDALNRTLTAFSDGITVLLQRPDPATVRDGESSNDVDFQEPTDQLSANWDAFGDAGSTLPSDRIVKYEAAIGTDRRHARTRSDIHAFEDVGLATETTFYGLNLTAKTVTYYVTVRAHSLAGSYIDGSSDGIRVGFSGEVSPGQVQADRFQSSNDTIRFSWTEFESDMKITHYYAGVSTTAPPWDNTTHLCGNILQTISFPFDTYPLHTLQTTSMAVLQNLSLAHGGTYYVTVIAADQMGHCSAAVSEEILVDTTPPFPGKISAEGTVRDTVIFLHSSQTVVTNLDGFPDPESGIDLVEVELLSSVDCIPGQSSSRETTIRTIKAKNESSVVMRSLTLETNTLYFLRAAVTNGAGLVTISTSRPLLLDTSPPLTGLVKLASAWTKPARLFQNETNAVQGLVALRSLGTSEECVTETNLLSPDKEDEWVAAKGNFSEDCVGIDASGMHVIVQHNEYLTGLDRGAAQFGELQWQEGDFTFRLLPATGEKILSGISLASPSLSPPFLAQNGIAPGNQSSLPCDSSNITCLSDSNNSTSESATLADTDYGIGLTFLKYEGEVKVLFWAQDMLQRQQSWLPIDFDPTSTAAEYVLNLKRTEGSQLSWEVTAVVNGQPKGGVSGLLFPGPFVISVYTWNLNNFSPAEVDPFHPFREVTLVTSVSMPVKVPPLCSYGSAFQDDDSGIKEIWAGVSDSFNATANIAPFQLLQSYCLPCLMGCDSICSACSRKFVSDDFTVLSLTRDGLSLKAAKGVSAENTTSQANATSMLDTDSEEDLNNPIHTYYMDIKVVDHSGIETVAKSDGFLVDTSPPIINFLRCFDPEYSGDEAVSFLGNNHTVGIQWDVYDDISNIEGVDLYLGTKPGLDDISPRIFLKEDLRNYVFRDVTPRFQDGTVYYVTIEVKNGAGMVNETWNNFTVKMSAPDMSAVKLSLPNVTTESVAGTEVGILDNTERLELNLNLDPEQENQLDVEYYEWAIGTSEGKDDIFPRTVVGPKGTTKVAIVDGFFQSDTDNKRISIGDYTKKNFSTDTPPDPSANKFLMEPGRCLYQQLFGVNKAHWSTALDVVPLCIKRPKDMLLQPDDAVHDLWIKGPNISHNTMTTSDSMHIRVKLSKGALLAGGLSESDLNSQYGSSASTEFSPFIIRPDPVTDATSRMVSTPGPDVFLSPVEDAEFDGDVEVTYTLPADFQLPDNSRAALIVWNPDASEWVAPEEICTGSVQQMNRDRLTISAKLCSEIFKRPSPGLNFRGKRAASRQASLGPRMLSVAVIKESTTNGAPVVHDTSFSMLEDEGTFSFVITYSDEEGDAMEFTLTQQPDHGTANVTDYGLLTYRPDPNFSGKDIIHVTGKEVIDSNSLALGVVPNVVSFDITVAVIDLNDPPAISYVPVPNTDNITQELRVGPTVGNGVNMSVLVEANTTTTATLGVVLFGDADHNDRVEFLGHASGAADANFKVLNLTSDDPRLLNTNLDFPSGPMGKEIVLNIGKGYSGHVNYEARVKDTSGTYSMQLTLDVYVLISPCVHGHCEPHAGTHRCQDSVRAFRFDPFACRCEFGFEGEWCETDTDECKTASCSPFTDCVDLVGGNRCDYNPGKLAAVVVSCIVAYAISMFVLYRCKKAKAKKTDAEEKLKLTDDPKQQSGQEPQDTGGPVKNERPRTPPIDYVTKAAFVYHADRRREFSVKRPRPERRDLRPGGRSTIPPADYEFSNPTYTEPSTLKPHHRQRVSVSAYSSSSSDRVSSEPPADYHFIGEGLGAALQGHRTKGLPHVSLNRSDLRKSRTSRYSSTSPTDFQVINPVFEDCLCDTKRVLQDDYDTPFRDEELLFERRNRPSGSGFKHSHKSYPENPRLEERHALVLILLAVLQLSLAVFTLIEDRWHGGFKAEVKLEAPVELQNWTVHLVFDQPVEGLLEQLPPWVHSTVYALFYYSPVPSVWQYDVTELSSLEYLVHSEEWNAHVRAGRKLTLHIAGTPQVSLDTPIYVCAYFEHLGNNDCGTDLLLVITENDCYTISMGDDDIIVLWINHRHSFMSVLEKTIEHEPDKVIHSSLLEMRKTYGDLLADYHCLDKRVGHVAIDEE
ncbi:hypothetical protein BaRGS_00038811, partial [Batillaria attramentaria]